MKVAAVILMLVWTILLAEPGFANYTKNVARNKTCAKQVKPVKQSCTRSSCSISQKTEESKTPDNDDCRNNRCNPLMSCPSGNFYLAGIAQPISAPFKIIITKKTITDDKRLSDQLSECWHPPETN